MPKQVRFAQLVKAAGKPHAATLWAKDPNADPEFKKAIAAHRILTVHNVNVGNKKDAGEIGFAAGPGNTFVIFPKPLPFAEGTKVIGLKFNMLEDQPVQHPVRVKAARRKTPREPVEIKIFNPPANEEATAKPKQKAEPAAKPKFKVTVEFKAIESKEIEVQAATAAGAIEVALKKAGRLAPKKARWSFDAQNVQRCD
jgi:hypothetical protein